MTENELNNLAEEAFSDFQYGEYESSLKGFIEINNICALNPELKRSNAFYNSCYFIALALQGIDEFKDLIETDLESAINYYLIAAKNPKMNAAYYQLGKLYINNQRKLPGNSNDNYFLGLGYYLKGCMLGNDQCLERSLLLKDTIPGSDSNNIKKTLIGAHNGDPDDFANCCLLLFNPTLGDNLEFIKESLLCKYDNHQHSWLSVIVTAATFLKIDDELFNKTHKKYPFYLSQNEDATELICKYFDGELKEKLLKVPCYFADNKNAEQIFFFHVDLSRMSTTTEDNEYVKNSIKEIMINHLLPPM